MSEINKQIFLSEETKKILEEETLLNLQGFTKLIDTLRNSLKVINSVKEQSLTISNQNSNNVDNDDYYHLLRLTEYSMLLGLLWLDITTAYRIYLNAKEKYEIIYSTKQLIVTISEGYKKLYHYVNIDKNGNSIVKYRNKSFWVKDIGGLLSSKLPHLLTEYEDITQELEAFIDEDLEIIKSKRDFIVHYDDNPSKIYDMLQNIDIELVTIKTIPFMKVLSKMITFSQKILLEYNTVIGKRTSDIYDLYLTKFENIKQQFKANTQVVEMISDFQNKLIELKGKKLF